MMSAPPEKALPAPVTTIAPISGSLFAAMIALGLALVSYTQTDPSGSTASGSPVENWMGLPGAWAAERVLLFFGLPGVLLLPLLFLLPPPPLLPLPLVLMLSAMEAGTQGQRDFTATAKCSAWHRASLAPTMST